MPEVPLTEELIQDQEHQLALDPQSVMLNGRTTETLQEPDKIVRDAFIREYIKDFNGKLAMHRIGVVNPKTASTKASIWLREPYCANRLNELVRQLRPEDVVTRQEIMCGLWKEANDPNNEGSTRVASLACLAKMSGLISPLPEKNGDTVNVTNVMFVPLVNLDQWASQASIMQTELRARASDRMPTLPAAVLEITSEQR